MRILNICIAIFLLVCAAAFDVNAAPKPNIILFIVDDMGWNDTSVEFAHGGTIWNKLYRTPNMEVLAAKGVKFTNAYCFPNS